MNSLLRVVVCDEGPPAAVEGDGADVEVLVWERHAGSVEFEQVALAVPLGLKERKKEGERYCHLGLSPSLLAKCQLSDLFQITHGERLLVGGEHLVELPSEPLGRGVAGGLQRREVAPARVAVALEHVRRRQLLPPLLAKNLRNPFLAFGNWALVTAYHLPYLPT